MLDDNGFPTNPEYLMSQGFDPVEANRQLVELQEQTKVLDQFKQFMAEATPDQAGQLIAQYRQLMGQDTQQPEAQRPEFPGGQPGDSQALTQQDLGAYYQSIMAAAKNGNPLDVIVRGGQTDMDRVVSQIPDEAWKAMAPYLIGGDF